ncbi:MAG: hypothetical protein KDK24_02140, partial [Pseudooceanicola sp.]|nr:hypothetical protein [Pseudooceanicola sp.]
MIVIDRNVGSGPANRRTIAPARIAPNSPTANKAVWGKLLNSRIRSANAGSPKKAHKTPKAAASPARRPTAGTGLPGHTARSTIIFLISAIAFAGFSPFGQ